VGAGLRYGAALPAGPGLVRATLARRVEEGGSEARC
jgi:hypothetical protein